MQIKQTYTQMNRELHTVANTVKEKSGVVGGHTENDGDLLSPQSSREVSLRKEQLGWHRKEERELVKQRGKEANILGRG